MDCCRCHSLTSVDVANVEGNKVALSTSMEDVAGHGLLVSLGGRPRIRIVSEGGDHSAEQVPAPETYALLKAKVVAAGRVTLTREELDALCNDVSEGQNVGCNSPPAVRRVYRFF